MESEWRKLQGWASAKEEALDWLDGCCPSLPGRSPSIRGRQEETPGTGMLCGAGEGRGSLWDSSRQKLPRCPGDHPAQPGSYLAVDLA